jgi:lipopolysaccharide transport system permease protein
MINNIAKNVIIYTPESSLRHPVCLLRDMFHDLFSARELAMQLAIRDVRAQYRQAALGLL